MIISFETYLNNLNGFKVREDRPAIDCSNVDQVPSGKLTWIQNVLIHNPKDTQQEAALQLNQRQTFTHTN